jgi:hypothetical protein|tara:strand:- start:1460 stop:1744 length:285 start_codon:yes stop_codon:yes gene_type:complete
MAKNKKKLVDLKPKKITDEQLQRTQTIVSNINNAQMQMGRLETQKHLLSHEVIKFQENLQVLRAELEKDYGTVNINIEDGTIKYDEDGEANKKN